MELDAITAELPAEPESAHTSSRKSARNPRIELITRGERRRRWTIEQKQTIAAQSLAPGASPTEVARQYGISSGQLYTWRHALLAAQPEAVMHTAGRFARVEVKAVRTAEHVSQEAAIEAPARGSAAAGQPDCPTVGSDRDRVGGWHGGADGRAGR